MTIVAEAVALRPQVDLWKREVPVGSGITGIWRPLQGKAAKPIVFTLLQSGNSLTGTVEGETWVFIGDEIAYPILEGKVDGGNISFQAGQSDYSGTIAGDRLELRRKAIPRRRLTDSQPKPQIVAPAGPQPAIKPPPNGSDPSVAPQAHPPTGAPVILHRVER